MHITKIKRIIALAVLLAAAGLTGLSYTGDSPSNEAVAFAERSSDLMLNELLAALFKEFDETTPDNVEEGKQAISLIFNDRNRDMRLIGRFAPLLGGSNDFPDDRFERDALRRALEGEPLTSVERINDTWYFHRSIPLSNTMHQNCVQCHANFTAETFGADNPGQWAGALVLGVPIR